MTSPQTINEAKDLIAAEAARLTAAIRAKGFPSAHVELWIGRSGIDGHCIAFVNDQPIAGAYGTDLDAIIAETDAKIAALPHKDAEALAYAEEMAQPLFLWSEHVLPPSAISAT